ncbi:MAG: hypothetical protein JNM71_16000 [Flavobacterium lindanitolerans]|jgi:hypothetical protein|uniref:WapI family immunity protein n=1 Tax=Flavobacterium lindanitolerans TaxID=428988 RepID=UPI001A646C46|nr:hypothetical protein [Flavobacterium lindanitolerans]MBL7869520.1 hypothetical protein [Flavobacterium lindanitolerans]
MKLVGNSSTFEMIVLGKSNPHTLNQYDSKWIKIELKIKLNGFLSHQFIELFKDDLIRFYNSINTSLSNFSIPIFLTTDEDAVYLKGTIDINGQVYWEGFNIYPIGNGNKLSFKFETELAQLDTLLIQLKKELKDL